MARTLVDCYQIDGKPMLAPDHDPEFSFSDLDSSVILCLMIAPHPLSTE